VIYIKSINTRFYGDFMENNPNLWTQVGSDSSMKIIAIVLAVMLVPTFIGGWFSNQAVNPAEECEECDVCATCGENLTIRLRLTTQH
jgi:high-affinity K+ transport system ATPase subunit B